MPRISERTIVSPRAAETTARDEASPGSTAAPLRGEGLVDAEETLRVYHENILLVGEALLALELMERGALDESEQRISELTQSYPDRESALLIRTLLSHWLSRTRTVAGEPAAERLSPVSARSGGHAPDEKTVASLKREGLNFYSRGDLSGAVSCWRRILELEPADMETRQFLQRAEAILKNRRAG